MFFSQLLLVAMVGIGRSCAENPIVEQLHDAEPAINAVLEQLRGTTPSKAGAGIAIADARPSNSMDVIKSAIGDAAENRRNLRTLSDDTGYWTACGRNGYCSNAFASAMSSDLNYVRCCSDSFKDGWVKQGDQCPYGESNLEVANFLEHKWNEGCASRKNYADARAACSNVGARLCTKAELHFDCAAESGCGSDDEMVWALSSEAIAPPPAPCPSSECSSPELGTAAAMPCCFRENSDESCNIRNGLFVYHVDHDYYDEIWGSWFDVDVLEVKFDEPLSNFFDACKGDNGKSIQSYCRVYPSECRSLI